MTNATPKLTDCQIKALKLAASQGGYLSNTSGARSATIAALHRAGLIAAKWEVNQYRGRFGSSLYGKTQYHVDVFGELTEAGRAYLALL